jgi:uncharacterized membrane protein YccC
VSAPRDQRARDLEALYDAVAADRDTLDYQYSEAMNVAIPALDAEIAELMAEVAKRTKTLMKILALQKDGEAEIAELKDERDALVAAVRELDKATRTPGVPGRRATNAAYDVMLRLFALVGIKEEEAS